MPSKKQSNQSRIFAGRQNIYRAVVQQLETRCLLSTVSWTNPSGGNWDVASNWSGGVVPGAGDNVLLQVSGDPTINFRQGTVSVASIQATDALLVSGGSLTVMSGTSQLSELTVNNGGTLAASGSTAVIHASSTTAVSGGSLIASAGGTIALTQLNSITTGTGFSNTLEATGANSFLSLSQVNSITGSSNYASGINIEALNGGDLKLDGLTTLTGQAFIESDGASSSLNLSALPAITATDNGFTSTVQASNGGVIFASNLTTFGGVTLSLDHASTMPISQITSFTSGQINATVDPRTFTSLTNLSGSGVTATNGAIVSFPALTTFTTGTGFATTLQANGAGSVLNLSHVTSITGSAAYASGVTIQALAGGSVNLSGMSFIAAQAALNTSGTNSVINVSIMDSYIATDNGFTSSVQALNGGSIQSPDLSILNGVILDYDGTGTLNVESVSDLTGTNISVSNGATLGFPTLMSYTTLTGNSVTFQAIGAGSVLNLTHLTTITGGPQYASGVAINALSGGTVRLTQLASITAQAILESDGTNSQLDLSNLASFTATDNGFTSTLQDSHSGTVLTGSLTSLSGVTLAIDGSGTIDISHITSATSSQINISGGTSNFAALTDLDASGILVTNGATATFPALLEYTTGTGFSMTLEASGTGSVLDLSHVTTLTGSAAYASGVNIEALAGGHVNLSALTSMTAQVFIQADGAASVLNLSALTTISATNNGFTSTLKATNSGTIQSSNLLHLDGMTFTLDGSGTINTSQIQSFTDGSLAVSSGTPNFNNVSDIDGSGITVSNGATLSLPSVTDAVTGTGFAQVIEAAGTGSVLNLPTLSDLEGSATYASGVSFEALAGGHINLSGLAQILAQASLVANGTGSVLDVSSLSDYEVTNNGFSSSVQAINGGTIDSGNLQILDGLTLNYDGTGTLSVAEVGEIIGTSITISNGATLAFPSLTSLQTNVGQSLLEATGTGSTLDLSHVIGISNNATYSTGVFIKALAGGDIKLGALLTSNGPVVLESDGTGSQLNISSMTEFDGSNNGFTSTLEATNHGAIQSGSLHTLDDVVLNFDGTGTISTSQITGFTNGQLNISGGSPSFAGLFTLDGSGVNVSNGATLALPNLFSYATPTGAAVTLQATGTGSTLNLSNLETISGSANYASGVTVTAAMGGSVNLPNLATVTGQASFTASDTGSVLNVPDLTSIVVSNNGFTSFLQASGGAAIESGSLTKINGVVLNYDGTGTLLVNKINDISDSGILVNNGGILAFPSLTSYQTPTGAQVALQADGAGSQLDLSHIRSFTGSSAYSSGVFVDATTGGKIDLSGVTAITAQAYLAALNTGSMLDLSSLRTFTASDNGYNSALIALAGATLKWGGFTWTNTELSPFNGSITASTDGALTLTNGSATAAASTGFVVTNSFNVTNGSALTVAGDISLNASAFLQSQSSSTIQITGNLLGNTQNAGAFQPLGQVLLNGSGTISTPQMLEAMSADAGAVAAGFTNNFAYTALALSNNTYVTLVDQSDNSPGSGSEAVYTNSLVVPAGSTLDLNGLHLYARVSEIAGSVINGSVTQVGQGGTLALATPTAGTIASTGALQSWTFFGRQGEDVFLQVNPGSSGSDASLPPYLNNVQVNLLDPSGTVLGSGTSTNAGQITDVPSVMLPADGTYTIQIGANSSAPGSTGNYTITRWDIVTKTLPLTLSQTETSTLASGYATDQWTFTGVAGEQVQFHLINSTGGILFSLQNGNGFSGFSGLTGDSGVVTLPSNGTYTLLAFPNTGVNTGSYAFSLNQMTVTPLTLGTPVATQLLGTGQQDVYSVMLPATTPLNISLTGIAGDHEEVYARFGSVPTPADYDYVAAAAGSANQQLLIPSATAGTWYILVDADNVPNTGSYTLTAAAPSITLSGATPNRYGQGASPTIVLTGAGFGAGTSVELVDGNGHTYPAASVLIDSPTQMSAIFAAGALPLGTYTIRVTSAGNATADLASAFTVVAGGTANLVTNLVVPSAIGYHIASTLFLTYSNTGTAAMPAPLLVVTGTQDGVQRALLTLDSSLVTSGFWTSATPQGYSNSIEILASGAVPGMLEPGESFTVPIYYAGWQQPWDFNYPPINFSVTPVTADSTASVDWSSFKDASRPANISVDAWNTIWPNFLAQVGSTAGQYVQFLDSNASYLGHLGENVTNPNELIGLAMEEVDGLTVNPTLATSTDAEIDSAGPTLSFIRTYQEPISDRYVLGTLGFGWSDNWQISLSKASDGTVTVNEPDGSQRIFEPDSRPDHGYFDQPGDYGVLANTGSSTFTLTETDGEIYAFNADGTLNFVQDIQGGRITLGYTSGKLTSLTASAGQYLHIAYNSVGLISTVTDSAGRVTTYTYDSANQYLMSVQDYTGRVTSYTYDTSTNSATSHALTQIANPDGTHQNFTYDSIGRLASTFMDGNANLITYTYGTGAEVTSSDALGDATQYYFDGRGLLVKYIDPLGNATELTYDANNDLVQTIDPADVTTNYSYDGRGNLIESTNAVGDITQFTYTSNNQLASVIDPNGNLTKYNYDPAGDLQSVLLPNGSEESWTYDAAGDPTGWTSPAGEPTMYTYDSAGHLLTATYSDSSEITYTYDTHGNLLTATDASGVIMMAYNTDDTLASITYPNGDYLHYTYDAAGRRTQMVDQVGDTTNYHYDAAGRLSNLTDQNGTQLVLYTYNTAGQLIQQTNNNGTYSTYAYDADGNLLDLINYKSGTTVNSRFDYTYDSRGRAISEATIDGTWTYSYDDLGELTHAVFASTGVVPSQDLTYVYDAMGNRIQTIQNGVTNNYTTNDLNEYTTVGSTTYTYDANGNLTSSHGGGITITYAYNARNQLVSNSGPGPNISYQYDALGQLLATNNGSVTTENLIDPVGLGNIVSQYNGSAQVVSFTYGLGLVSETFASNTLYYAFDGTGSTADVTGLTGNVVGSYFYLPFGETTTIQSIFNPFTFTGKYGVLTDANGLLTMRARNYDSPLGQFMSNDPLGLASGTINLRTYVGNNPITYVDPSGLVSQFVGFSGGLGLDVTIGLTYNDDGTAFGTFGFGGTTGGVTVYSANSGNVGAGDSINFNGTLGGGFVGVNANNSLSTGGYSGSVGVSAGFKVPGFTVERTTYWPLPGLNVPPPPGGSGSTPVPSHDPNAKLGPAGFGTSGFINGTGILPYTIDFENSPSATAPAQQVNITDQLDSNIDWNTFALTSIGFGDTVIPVPVGSAQHFQTTVSMTYNNVTFNVLVDAGINLGTGEVFADFFSIDPNTDLPPDVLIGFLPPEDGTGRGDGYVGYTVSLKPNLASGTQIKNVADISFDNQPIITTDQVNDDDASQGTTSAKEDINTIDAVAPTSSVTALPATESVTNFLVSWSGTDNTGGSGVGSYAIYVSDNGGAFTLWENTAATSANYPGAAGHTYSFYSVATDNVGNVEATPTAAQTSTTVSTTAITTGAATQLVFVQQPANTTAGQTITPIVIDVEDADGNLVTADNSPVTISITGATLGGTVTVNAVNGVATFSDLSLTKAGSYVLTVSDGSLAGASSNTFTISAGPAATLLLTTQPSNTTGQNLAALSAEVEDAFGNPISGASVTFTIASGPTNAVLGGTTTVTTGSNGIATFSNLTLNRVGSYTLTANSGNLTAVTTNSFTLTYAGPQLVFDGEPANIVAGGKLPAITVSTDDANGNLITTKSKNKITLKILSGPAGGKLIGSASGSIKNGHAVFSKLSIQKAGTYVLEATEAGFGTGDSISFVVTAAAAKKMAFTQQPPAQLASSTPFSVQLQLVDRYGNLATNDDSVVTLTLGTHPKGSVLDGVLSETVTDGLASFSDLTLATPGKYSIAAAANEKVAKTKSKTFVVT